MVPFHHDRKKCTLKTVVITVLDVSEDTSHAPRAGPPPGTKNFLEAVVVMSL